MMAGEGFDASNWFADRFGDFLFGDSVRDDHED